MTDISMQVEHFGGSGRNKNALPGERPDHLPIAAKVWDISAQYGYGSTGKTVIEALYQAVKDLETEVQQLRA
ncbi:hypothetical protein [Nocardia bovistercoris]|nr:hypothetical protein [Nocardia bovistercoris]